MAYNTDTAILLRFDDVGQGPDTHVRDSSEKFFDVPFYYTNNNFEVHSGAGPSGINALEVNKGGNTAYPKLNQWIRPLVHPNGKGVRFDFSFKCDLDDDNYQYLLYFVFNSSNYGYCYLNLIDNMIEFYLYDSSSNTLGTCTHTFPGTTIIDDWHHVRWSISPTAMAVGINGTGIYSTTGTGFLPADNSYALDVFTIGGTEYTGSFRGKIANFQWLNTNTYVSGNYTVPGLFDSATKPDNSSYDTTTRLLLRGNADPIIDSSGSVHALTTLGTAGQITTDSPFGTGTGKGCIEFNGTTNWGRVEVDAPGDIFTAATPNSYRGIDFFWSHDDGDYLLVLEDGNGAFLRFNTSFSGTQLTVDSYDGTNQQTTNYPIENSAILSWNHAYFQVYGNQIRVGINGTYRGTFSPSWDIFADWTALTKCYVGEYYTGSIHYPFDGRMDSIRLREGMSQWTDDYYIVPHTEPVGQIPAGTPITVNLTGQSFSFAQTAPGVGLPVNVTLSGQDIPFAQFSPVYAVVRQKTAARLWARQPTKRLIADRLNPMTGGRDGAYRIAREFWEVANPDKSVALTGVTIPFATGSVAASSAGAGVNINLTGQSIGYLQGNLAPSRTHALSSQVITFSQGGIGPVVKSVPVSGTAISITPGAITASVAQNLTIALTGQAITFSAGTLRGEQILPYFDYTRAQFKFNEANNSTSTEDSSSHQRTSTFSGSAEVATEKFKYGSGSLSIGNPTGTKTAGRIEVGSPNTIFTNSSSTVKVISCFYAAEDSSSMTLFSGETWFGNRLKISRRSDDKIRVEVTYISPYENIVAEFSFTPLSPTNSWNYLHVEFVNEYINVRHNDVYLGYATRAGQAPVLDSQWYFDYFWIGQDKAAPSSEVFYGYIDAVVITQGGSFPTTTPAGEREGAPVGRTGSGANTVENTSSSTVGYRGIDGTFAGLVVDDVVSTATLERELLVSGGNATDDVTTEGVLAKGTILWAEGQNTLDAIVSDTTATVQNTRYLIGAATIDAVTSTGSGYIWANIRGANTTGAVTSTGTGDNSIVVQPLFCAAANTTETVTSTGAGELPIVGSCANQTNITSFGEIFNGAVFFGANTLDPFASTGAGYVGNRAGQGTNTTGEITSSASGLLSIFGGAVSDTSVTSTSYAALLINGVAANTVDDVKTGFPAGYFDHYNMEFVKTLESVVWVR